MSTNMYAKYHDHLSWLNKLSLYTDEINLMQKKLENVAGKNSSMELKKEVARFQDQLISQKSSTDNLEHHIKREKKISGMRSGKTR